ncbi:hypothetical protein GUJ93_ZPchr0010g7647 [Zizania palustris]|uniref:Uncharacterized protein n=1 Tax=Zizania palustris TaxID=103762 RepID=A0A8J6BL33_ZIZPA|nr:hypothetical protein GUJ93_ZPchr0010g7647 [Zizania palustris]
MGGGPRTRGGAPAGLSLAAGSARAQISGVSGGHRSLRAHVHRRLIHTMSQITKFPNFLAIIPIVITTARVAAAVASGCPRRVASAAAASLSRHLPLPSHPVPAVLTHPCPPPSLPPAIRPLPAVVSHLRRCDRWFAPPLHESTGHPGVFLLLVALSITLCSQLYECMGA